MAHKNLSFYMKKLMPFKMQVQYKKESCSTWNSNITRNLIKMGIHDAIHGWWNCHRELNQRLSSSKVYFPNVLYLGEILGQSLWGCKFFSWRLAFVELGYKHWISGFFNLFPLCVFLFLLVILWITNSCYFDHWRTLRVRRHCIMLLFVKGKILLSFL